MLVSFTPFALFIYTIGTFSLGFIFSALCRVGERDE